MENENENLILPEDKSKLSASVIVMDKICENPRCQKPFQTTSHKRKFCTPKCSARYFALNYYNKIKDDAGHKLKRKENNKRWIETHRDIFNARMRIYSKSYYHRQKDKKEETKTNDNNNQ